MPPSPPAHVHACVHACMYACMGETKSKRVNLVPRASAWRTLCAHLHSISRCARTNTSLALRSRIGGTRPRTDAHSQSGVAKTCAHTWVHSAPSRGHARTHACIRRPRAGMGRVSDGSRLAGGEAAFPRRVNWDRRLRDWCLAWWQRMFACAHARDLANARHGCSPTRQAGVARERDAQESASAWHLR